MKHGIYLALVFVVLLMSCQSQNDNIKVGAAIAITGYGADFGQSERNAIELLKEKYENENIEFIIEDTRSDVKSGLNAINKLIHVNKCDVIYCELSSIVNASLSIIDKAKVQLIAPVYLENLSDSPFAIRNLPSAEQENKALIDYLIKENIPIENVGVLYSNDVFGETCNNSFISLLPDESKICFSSTIDENALRELSLKLVKANPDVVYIGSMVESMGLLIRFLRQNGYNKTIITTDAFSYDYINSLAGEYADGVLYVDFMDTDNYIQFQNEYLSRFGIPCVASSMLCYDGISMIYSAMKEGELNNDYYYDGLTGKLSLIDNNIIYPIQVKIWSK